MPALTQFRYFSNLPPELQLKIWKHYHEQRGVRHYLTISSNGRHYAAIDVDAHRFIRTFLRPHPEYHEVIATDEPWPLGHPASGEQLVTSYFRGDHSCLKMKARSPARSIITTKDISFPIARPSLWVRTNFQKDVVLIDGTHTEVCLEPVWGLQGPQLLWQKSYWFYQVQKLAIQLSPGQLSVDKASMDFLTELPQLRMVYLVVYRDSNCPLGRPWDWSSVNKNDLNEDNFLPWGLFNYIHPDNEDVGCECLAGWDPSPKYHRSLLGNLRHNWKFYGHRSYIGLEIVVDPY
ncbi:hypothetical protein GGS26DRAFT_601992 [Hypomontagnella submonticulosa]|nr:hypothetical protein GGS26DRAFT_601992 [Hypomontagnella submonticulosa]